ncbi:HD domain-containing protein [Faecalicatena sp.]|uniref:HD domain-containing protein n=1 Tax=Faecalicatena sp. TaxID=2005360 RepID=UPI002A92F510|nr:HD domain-containing protein [Lachnospiraceae bacterium]
MNLDHAKEIFENYLDSYDRDDVKIRLKIVHTYGVVEQSKEIARRMHLSDEDSRLAQLIALLHDIGRFEQLKQFDSFEPGTIHRGISKSHRQPTDYPLCL